MTATSPRDASIVVLAKHADEAKSRLGLPRDSTRHTALFLAARTIRAAMTARTVGAVLVVTRDEAIAADAVRAGADVAWEGPRSLGMNRAADLGRRHVLQTRPHAPVAIVVADLPYLQPKDIDVVLTEYAVRKRAMLVPDLHGTGTTALICGPDQRLGSAFGRQSARLHVRLGYVPTRSAVRGLRADLDTLDDLMEAGLLGYRDSPRRPGDAHVATMGK